MTDTEIIKALKCCSTASCISKQCPYEKTHDIPKCTTKLTKDALGLINRQKAEIDALRKTILDADYSSITALKAKESWHMENSEYIDRLKEEIEKLRKRVNFVEQANVQLREELKETTEKFNCQQYVYADLSDIIRDKNAEIERLNKEVDRLSQIVLYHDGHIADARAEAIKEFAERLKKIAYKYFVYSVTVNEIDNLVKEMVGDSK